MTTLEGAWGVVRTRLNANVPTYPNVDEIPIRYLNDNQDPLPNEPAPFIFVDWVSDPGELASFGGGAGANRWRYRARCVFYVFIPAGAGLEAAANIAEQVATVFRGYRDSSISCFDCTVYPGGSGKALNPPGIDSAVDNYFWAAAELDLFYDLIG